MTSVDSRIVTMKFDNARFQRDVGTTMGTMDKLKQSLNFSGAKTGLDTVSAKFANFGAGGKFFGGPKKDLSELQGQADHFQLGGIDGAITHVSGKFIALSTVAITALSGITSQAISTATSVAKSLTIAPIMSGFHEYETNLNSIQTVLSNTKDQGSTLDDVNGALQDLNKYSDKTIYNFSEMAHNIGTFTAAGVDLKTSVSSIKGIANLAAISGSNSEQASTAMYQLSQAISSGRVGLQDWNSVVNAGMGGSVFQKALARTAANMGTVGKNSVQTSGKMKKLTINGESFRESIQAKPGKKSWLTSDVLTNTLKQLSGDMTEAQLKAQGFTDAQVKQIQVMAKTGVDAATKVKTLSQLMDTLKESVGSGWTNTWQLLFGNFKEASKTFTSVSNILGAVIQHSANARNKVLGDWKKLGGRTVLIDAISNAFKALISVIKPIHAAFREIFPRKTGKDLFAITLALRNFTKHLILGGHTSKNVHTIFKGVFAVLSIGVSILKGIVHYWTSLFGILAGGSGGLLDFVASIAKLLIKLQQWLAQGDKVGAFFDKIIGTRAMVLKPIIQGFSTLLTLVGKLITSGSEKIFAWMAGLKPYAKDLQAMIEKFRGVARTKVVDYLGQLQGYLKTVRTYVVSLMGPIGVWLAQFRPLGRNINTLVGAFKDLVSTGAEELFAKLSDGASNLGPIFAAFGDALKGGLSGLIGSLQGSVDIGNVFGDIGGQTSVASAGIDGVKTSLSAVAGQGDRVKAAWGGIVAAFKAVAGFLQPAWDAIKGLFSGLKDRLMNFVQDMGIQDGLAVVNTGFFIAFYMMLRSFIKSVKGLVGAAKETFDNINGVLSQTTSTLKTMQNDVRANIILKIAASLALLAVALLILSRIPMKQLGVALGAVAALLVMMVVAMKSLEKNLDIKTAASMTLLSAALIAMGLAVLEMAAAVALLGRLKPATLAKGLGAIAVILGIMVATTKGLQNAGGAKELILAAAGILLLAAGLTAFAGAIKLFASIKESTLTRGGLRIAAMLAAVAIVMTLMPPTMLSSAAGLLIMAGALVVIAGAMKIFASMSVVDMAKSLIMLAASLGILAVTMALMEAGLPGAAALLVMAAGIALLVPALAALGGLDFKTMGKALLFLAALFTLLGVASLILTPVVPVILALGVAMGVFGLALLAVGGGLLLFATGLAVLAASGAAGAAVLVGVLTSIAATFPLLMQQLGLGVIAFAVVIRKAGPKLVGAFAVLVSSMADAVVKAAPHIGRALMVLIHTALRVVRSTFPDLVQTGFDVLMALLNGINNNIGRIVKVAGSIIFRFITGLAKQEAKIITAAVNFIITFVNGLANAIRKNSDRMNRAGGNLARAIIQGMINGLGSGAKAVFDAAKNLGKSALHGVAHFLKLGSPSKEFHKVGQYTSLGLANGLESYSGVVEKSAASVAGTALDTITATMNRVQDAFIDAADMNPTITPVLDLTQMANDASRISGLLSTAPVTTGVSLTQASGILSAQQQAAQDAAAAASSTADTPTEIKFEQNNYSPKALSSVEVYRQTRNQLSLAKEALKA